MKSRLSDLYEALSLLDGAQIASAIKMLKQAREHDSFVWIAGNGGSAATASHFANDLLKMCHIKAIDISGMTPITTAFGNDCGWEHMFSSTIQGLAKGDDVIVLITCSGNSKNILSVISSLENMNIIVMTGEGAGEISKYTFPVFINAMSDEITVQEDIHSIACHEISWRIAHG